MSRNQVLRDFFYGFGNALIARACCWLGKNKFKDNWETCWMFLLVYLATGEPEPGTSGGVREGVSACDKAGI